MGSGTIGGVRGTLLKWAREQQGLTMRWVREHGGPSAGYQCEVEKGDKTEVRCSTLAAWVRVLGVTDSYARGQVPHCLQDPERSKGMAAAVADWVREAPPAWQAMAPDERVVQVMKLIIRLPHLPRVVLAHAMYLGLGTLDAIIVGDHPVVKKHMEAVSLLTTLPEKFFQHGDLDLPVTLPGEWLTAVDEAQRAGVTPGQVRAWIRERGQ